MTNGELKNAVATLARNAFIDCEIHAALRDQKTKRSRWLNVVTGTASAAAFASFFDAVGFAPTWVKPTLVLITALLGSCNLVFKPGDAALQQAFLKDGFNRLARAAGDLLGEIKGAMADEASNELNAWSRCLGAHADLLEGLQGKRPGKLAERAMREVDQSQPQLAAIVKDAARSRVQAPP